MSENAPDLATLQRWLSVVVQHPRNAAAGIRSRAGRELIPAGEALRGAVVVPTDRQTPAERLDVYNGGYLTRLKDTLASDFSGVEHALGPHAWFHVCHAYVAKHPSQHQNLIHFGRHLPDFLAKRKGLPNRAFLRDLARLEWAMTEAFHAPGFEPMDVAALQELSPEQWAGVVFESNPSLRLLETSYPVNGYLQSFFDDADPAIPGRTTARVAVYRHDDRVWRLRLSRHAHATLGALCDGVPFAQALENAGPEAHRVGDWFQDWSADGLFLSAHR